MAAEEEALVELEEKERAEKEEKVSKPCASKSEIAKEESQKVKEELRARDEEIKKVLKELQEARTEGMKRSDSKVQTLESKILDHLKVDSNSWISKDNSLDDLIKKLQEVSDISGKVQAREWLDEKVLLQKCSNGRALQGILVSKKTSDLLEDRSRLLELPENVVLTGASQSQDKVKQFSSKHQEDEFKNAVDIVGYSIVLSERGSIYGVVSVAADETASGKTKNISAQEQHIKETYSSTVKFSTMQVASYSFEKKDLRLSEDAQDELRELYKLVKIKGQASDDSAIQQACEKFFHTFGSHVNKGPLGFGGKFCWTCSSRGYSQDRRQTVDSIQSTVISTSADVSCAGWGISTELSMEKSKGSFTGKKAEDLFACTSFQVRIDGGPPETSDLSLWKKGLVANNSTWILSDRGSKLIPVWDVIKINHNKEFGDIREVLRSAWEKMTGLKSEPDILSVLSFDSDDVLQQVSEWNKEEIMASQHIQDKLEYLMKVRGDIISKTSDKGYWISEYLSHFEVQNFFLLLINSESLSGHLKSLMQQLAEEEDLKQLNTLIFPSIEKVSLYLYPPSSLVNSVYPEEEIADFGLLDKFLAKTLEDGRIAVFKDQVVNISMKVSKAISSLQSHCRQTYDEILISILVYPYQSANIDGVVTLKTISLDDLECLLKSFFKQKQNLNAYIKKTPLQLQAYLFYTAVDQQHHPVKKSLFHAHLQQLSQMMGHIKPVDKDILNCLKAYLHGGTLRIFKQSLHALLSSLGNAQGKPQQLSHPVNSDNSLQSILQTASQLHEVKATEFSFELKSNPEACELLEKLGLHEFYPKKLGLQDALCIRPEPLQLSLNNKPPTDPKQLPYLILHKIMSYDPLCRSDLMPTSNEASSVQMIDDFDSFDDSQDEQVDSSSSWIHPVDSLLALIMCSDDFLCQDLLSRLAKCQLAIPFLLPDPFSDLLTLPLWAMRTIIKEWKSTSSSNESVQHTCPIVSHKMPVVSFIRLGKHQDHGKSKSKILNDVLSDSHCDHFFHRDCPGGQQATLLGKGLVDMCWYLPAGKPSDAFSDAVTFLNLHGDAREHQYQCRFLSRISSMCFVLLTEEEIKLDSKTMDTLKAFNSCHGGITLLNGVLKKPNSLKQAIPKVRLIQLQERNASQVRDAIRTLIKTTLADADFHAIEDLCMVKDDHITMDEYGNSYSQGLKLASDLKSIVTDYTTTKLSLKDAMVPLQGKNLWKGWASSNKELYRQTMRGKKTVNDYAAEIESEKETIRAQQLEHVSSLSPVMKCFITSLLKLEGLNNAVLRNYYYQCLKLELNNLSRERISGMQRQYNSTRKALTEAEGELEGRNCKGLRLKLEELQEDINDSSFGLEHLFREVGQVYEAALTSHQYNKTSLACLPRAVAELMIDGYPLELMDGDAAHVPLEWVTAVLEQVVDILDDSEVFVLSVLGLQSTGKSTMLNTVFGLQFNVSAGRCTRGAFMQLVPLDETLQQKTKCRYVLVVDTEGLRAPELDPLKTQKHDNELATFVIGLANMTLINIYGEVAGDMDDILQTSVHAFLRMTQVKYSPSCQFVHQNVGANAEVGKAKFIQKLNQFTIDAAKEENCEEVFKCFNDVIKFNAQSDVHHFPGLWEGDPPMAPVNQGYSYSAQMLKQHLIQCICKRAGNNNMGIATGKGINDCCLSSFVGKIIDLWKSLLKENFLFSFKNSLEITAYISLENAFGKWEWKFRQCMLDWERKAENKISAAAVQDVPILEQCMIKELQLYVETEVLQPIKVEMKAFFSGKRSEILAQWRTKFDIRLENLAVELKLHAEKLCIQLKDSKEVISKFQQDQETYAKIITDKVYEYIASIKKKQEELSESLQQKKLEPEQVKKILERNLFTPENLKRYREHGVITDDQKDRLSSVILSGGGQLTQAQFNQIIVGGILGTEQLKKILKKDRQTKAELKKKFDQIWIELVEKLALVSGSQVNVENELEMELTRKVQGYDGQLVSTMREKKSLREWGNDSFIPEEGKHFSFHFREKAKSFFTFWHKDNVLDEYQKRVLAITERITANACQFLKLNITAKGTDFNATYVHELLHEVDRLLAEERKVLDRISLSQEYKRVIYLIVCGSAVPEFEKMVEAYKMRTDPRMYLEKNVKGPLFAKFENQYNQTEAEEAIANTLCSYFEEPIKSQIDKTLGSIMVDKMKNDERHFENKSALRVKILKDLYKKDNFKSYMIYAANPGLYLADQLHGHIVEYCDKETSTGNSRLQVQAKEQVSCLIKLIENVVTDVNEPSMKQWLLTFCSKKKLEEEMGISLTAEEFCCDEQDEWNPENLKELIREGLGELKRKLHGLFNDITCKVEMEKWKDHPHDILVKLVVGCTEQCPFCEEQCDWRQPDHLGDQKHKVEVHRPDCFKGYYISNNRLTTEFCPAQVAGDGKFESYEGSGSYKDYKKVYPDWSIPPDSTSENCLYWKWFVAKYSSELVEYFAAESIEYPPQWHDITWEEVEENLNSTYKL